MWVEHLTRESRELGSKSFLVCHYFPIPLQYQAKLNLETKLCIDLFILNFLFIIVDKILDLKR